MKQPHKGVYEASIMVDDSELKLQFGKLAQQATSSVLATLGETTVLVTVVAGKLRDDLDYFPLSVEYVEKLYAGGRIKGSRWVKKEGKPTDDAILKGRLIDRSIRPLFPKNYKRDVQVVITTLSVDGVHPAEIVGAIAVSAALHVSSIPFMTPIGTMRIGYIRHESGDAAFVVHPTFEEDAMSDLDLIVSSSKDKVLMIETQASELPHTVIQEAIKLAKAENRKIIDFIESLRAEIGVEKEEVEPDELNEVLMQFIKDNFLAEMTDLIEKNSLKESSDASAAEKLADAIIEKAGEGVYDKTKVLGVIDALGKKMIKERILDTKVRMDGRDPFTVRPLSIEVGVLPRVHGSALFQRGDTQVMSIATLGAPSMTQLVESPEGEEERHYMHHYNMPPYTVGETGRIGFASRREIGHGALAEKALVPVLPKPSDFPYAVRVVSEVLSSNGSTSMASTCGSSLALMDAGVPIKAPVSGIAMGLVSRSDDDYVILTDIMGHEDFAGEMDFKVAGTREGVTAMQLDVKNAGLTDKMISEIFEQAEKGRLHILDAMDAVISKPRTELSSHAPKIVVIKIPTDKIGEVIGPGGKNIRAMIAKSNTDISIEDDGAVTITGVDMNGINLAVGMIQSIAKEPEVGEEYIGTVERILPFGAFVEIMPGRDGLIHVSKMGRGFVRRPEDVLKIGQEVKVKVIQIDPQGRINLELVS
ncbi:MAG: polyribonucleotide nucleotidyltransferase [Patescibacteria group bacterium]|nr:polyribonucleotide nucleotidyltransferase [Patescibacteria group bacterium]